MRTTDFCVMRKAAVFIALISGLTMSRAVQPGQQAPRVPAQGTEPKTVPTPGIPSTGFAGLDNYRASRIAMFTDDYGQLMRYRGANEALKAGAPSPDRVVFFGDSITDMWKLEQYFP